MLVYYFVPFTFNNPYPSKFQAAIIL